MWTATGAFSPEAIQRSHYVRVGLQTYPGTKVFIFWNSSNSKVSFKLFMVDDETCVWNYAFYLNRLMKYL